MMSTPMPIPTRQELKKFGTQVGGIFLFIAAIFIWRKGLGHPIAIVSLALGVWLLPLGLLAPDKLAFPHYYWMKLAAFLARYVGHYIGMLFFTVIYIVLFMPVAWIMRLVKFDPLGLTRHRKMESYWHERPFPLTHDHYEHQFSIERRNDE